MRAAIYARMSSAVAAASVALVPTLACATAPEVERDLREVPLFQGAEIGCAYEILDTVQWPPSGKFTTKFLDGLQMRAIQRFGEEVDAVVEVGPRDTGAQMGFAGTAVRFEDPACVPRLADRID